MKDRSLRSLLLLASLTLPVAYLSGCGGDSSSGDSDSTETTTETTTTTTDDSTTTDTSDDSSTTAIDTSGVDITDCESDTDIETVVCAAESFISTLTSDEQTSLIYDWSDSTAKTTWSNFPVGIASRNGLRFGDLSEESVTAALGVARAALSEAGYEDFIAMLKADDYHLSQ